MCWTFKHFRAAKIIGICGMAGICLIAVSLWAQTSTRNNPNPDISGANLPSQKIGLNDLIAVSVYDAPELTRTIRVSSDGYIRLPMVKQPIRASGLLPSEMETAIAGVLLSEGILVDPIVTVTISEYQSHSISVMGAVKKPLTFQATSPVSVLDALARAEGLAADAGREILITRSEPGSDGKPASLTLRIPVKGLIDSADPQYNIMLHGGEEIRVPEIPKLFVVGNVKKPGAFPIQDGGETTVLQTLAIAEGLTPYASKQAFIYRREAQGNKSEILVELQKIMDRKAPDVQLAANDILYIPDNRGRRATFAVLEKILSFGAGTASGVIVYRSINK